MKAHDHDYVCVFLLCGGCKASDRPEDDVVDEKTQVQEEEDSSHVFGQSPFVRNHSSSCAEQRYGKNDNGRNHVVFIGRRDQYRLFSTMDYPRLDEVRNT